MIPGKISFLLKYIIEGMNASLQIVVARYNEDISWLQPVISHCLIYNKGTPLMPPPIIHNEIHIENKGRESETYLRYIIENYTSLPDVVIFTQANISDHNYSRLDPVSYLLQLGKDAFRYGKSRPTLSHKHNPQHPQNIHWGKHWNLHQNTYYLQNNYKDNTPILFDHWFTKHIQPEYPDPIHVYQNGIFAIRKDFILCRPLAFYQSLLPEINHHNDPAEGHFFERSWYYIFNNNQSLFRKKMF
jgi:hypothetical protein